MRRVSTLIVLGAILAAPLSADEVRTKDGRVLVGKTTTRGSYLEVATLDGTVKIKREDVASIRTDDELRSEFEQLVARTEESAFGFVQLATTAHTFGLYDEMWQMLDAALAAHPAAATQRQLRSLLADLEPVLLPVKYRKAGTKIRLREILFRIHKGGSPGRVAAVEELLVREPDADEGLRMHARSGHHQAQRLAALHALMRRGDNDRFVYRTTILDRSAAVRAKVAQWVGQEGRTDAAIRYLAPGLMHHEPAYRIRTAEAFGWMADEFAIDYLVAAGPVAGVPAAGAAGVGQRGNVAFVTQQSYIRDFDVEVAQASFIADPQIDVIQSGVVLDATVAAVVTHRVEIVNAYRGALRHLAGSDPGRDTRGWEDWRDGLAAQKVGG